MNVCMMGNCCREKRHVVGQFVSASDLCFSLFGFLLCNWPLQPPSSSAAIRLISCDPQGAQEVKVACLAPLVLSRVAALHAWHARQPQECCAMLACLTGSTFSHACTCILSETLSRPDSSWPPRTTATRGAFEWKQWVQLRNCVFWFP